MSTATKIFAVLVALLLVIPASQLAAQSLTSGAAAGTVTDPSGAVIPGATITLSSPSKGTTQTQTTTGSGGYRFSLLQPGDYKLTIDAKGFNKEEINVAVLVGETTSRDIHLTLGTKTEVTVTEEVPLVNTETAEQQQAYTSQQIENLPNAGNDLTYIAQTAPGVMMNTSGGYGNFNVHGTPASSNVFTIDGANDMDPFLNLNNSGPTNLMLGKNSIQEATVVTDAFGGQYGQQAGAQVNYVSKSGTNSFHGNAQYQWSDKSLDSNDWFNNRGGAGAFPGTSIPLGFNINNQWQASLGGPIKKDKTFFFLDMEGVRYKADAAYTLYVPSTAFANAVNSALPTFPGVSASTIGAYANFFKLYQQAPNYANGTPVRNSCFDADFGANLGTEFAMTPLGAALAANGIAGNDGCLNTYQTTAGEPASESVGIGRIDHNFGPNDRAFFRFDIDTGIQATYADPINPAFSASSYQPAYENTLTYTHNFGANATNQLVVTGDYYRAIFNENANPGVQNPSVNQVCQNSGTGTNSSYGSPFGCGFSIIGTGNGAYSALGGVVDPDYIWPQGRNVSQYQAVDDYARTVGKHNLKFGINFRRYDITDYDANVLATPLVEATLTDFVQGQADVYVQANPLRKSAPDNTGGFGLYAQDEWAVTQRFKLTLGLRLEKDFNPTCDTNCFTLLNGSFASVSTQGVNTPYNQALLTGRNTLFSSLDSVNLAPRIGFTWSPFASGKTVISAGGGIFYDNFQASLADSFTGLPYSVQAVLVSPPFGGPAPLFWGDPTSAPTTFANGVAIIRNGCTAGVDGCTTTVPSLVNGLTASQLPIGFTPSVQSQYGNFHVPQYQEWNGGIQQQLDSKSSLSLSYSGNHGIHEAFSNPNFNTAGFSGGGPAGLVPIPGYPGVVDPRFGEVTQWFSGALSNYNGVTAAYNRRLTYGFVIQGNFTYAHALDEVSNGGLGAYGGSSILAQINPTCLRCNNYGNADYDARKTFNASYVWTEPFKFNNAIARYVLGGWTLSENFFARSGLPLTLTDGDSLLPTGGGSVPIQVLTGGQNSCTNGNSQCLNPGNYTNVGVGIGGVPLNFFPTERRNQYRGPGFFDSDVTVGKDFHITEAMKLTVGANVYNFLNHQNFHNPSGTWTTATCDAGGAFGGVTPNQCTTGLFGQVSSTAFPPTGIFGSFFPGAPDARILQLQAKLTF